MISFEPQQSFLRVNWGALWSCLGIFDVVSLLLGIAGVWLAVRLELKARKLEKALETAQSAARKARNRLLLQRAVEDFEKLSEGAAELSDAVGKQKWGKASQQIPYLRSLLSQATSSFAILIPSLQRDELKAAASTVAELSRSLPTEDDAESIGDAQVAIREQASFVLEVVARVLGTIKYSDPENTNE